jgi:hypothetical protein
MAVWRRKALALLPEFRRELGLRSYTLYQLFFDLVPAVQDAHRQGDDDLLRRAYGFAEWCLFQKSKDLWNPAGVAFYEDLFHCDRSLWERIIPWLSPEVIAQVRGLWEVMLKPGVYQELVSILAGHMESTTRANVFSTGEMKRL